MTRERSGDLLFAIACLIAFAGLLWLGSGLTFARDEWSAIRAADGGTLETLLRPVNEHFAPLLRLAWGSLLATVGLRSYVPYLVVDHLFVVATAAGLYVLARRLTHVSIALAIGILYLLLGTGAENLFLAFQMGWTGAAAAGTWALVLLLREPAPTRTWPIGLLLVLAVGAFSSIGLPFVAAVGATIVVSRDRWRAWWNVLPALVLYAAWYLGSGEAAGVRPPAPTAIALFVEGGIAHAVGQVSGVGRSIGLIIAVLLGLAAIGDVALRRHPRLALVAGTVGLASLWLLIAIGRAGDLPDTFTAPRYVHVSAVFVLFAVVGLVGGRMSRRPASPARIAMAVGAVMLLALGWNVHRLVWHHAFWDSEAADYRASIRLLLEYGGTPALPDDRGLVRGPDRTLLLAAEGEGSLIPGPAALRALVARHGSPVDDPLAIRGASIPAWALDAAFERLTGHGLVIDARPLPADDLRPPDVTAATDLRLSSGSGCLVAVPAGAEPTLDLRVPSGGLLGISASTGGRAASTMSLTGAFAAPPQPLQLVTETPVRIRLPDLGADGPTLHFRLQPPAGTTMTLCLAGSTGTGSDVGPSASISTPARACVRPAGCARGQPTAAVAAPTKRSRATR